MLGKITPRTKLVYIANPNNPTGTMVGEDEFTHFMKEVPDNVVVVIDEAYREYILNTNYPVTLPHVMDGKKLIILRTFSKIYGLAGFRIGYGIADPFTIGYMNKVRHPFNTNSLGQVAAIAAIDDEEHVKRSVEVNDTGKRLLYSAFKELPLKYTETWANFILVELEKDARDVYQELLKRGVIVRPVGGFGIQNGLRITIGTEPENKRLITAMRDVLLPDNES
jgi:histidinol-phosphate aminotransferase